MSLVHPSQSLKPELAQMMIDVQIPPRIQSRSDISAKNLRKSSFRSVSFPSVFT
jgi:hypothetical protein